MGRTGRKRDVNASDVSYEEQDENDIGGIEDEKIFDVYAALLDREQPQQLIGLWLAVLIFVPEKD